MTDIQTGDKVRLTVEGVVDYVTQRDEKQTYITMNGRDFRFDTYKVEVIEKAKPVLKVGQQIWGELYKALPAGAVVSAGAQFAIADGKGTIIAQTGRVVSDPWNHRTLVYLP